MCACCCLPACDCLCLLLPACYCLLSTASVPACLLLPLLGTAATFTNLLMLQMKGVEVRVCYCLLATACHSLVPQGGLLPATAYLTSSRVS